MILLHTMRYSRHWQRIGLVIIYLTLIFAGVGRVQAVGEDESKNRQAKILVPIIKYDWWLIQWSDNQVLCQSSVDHEGLPTADEIYHDCGKAIYTQWISTPLCTTELLKSPLGCTGIYLFLVSQGSAEKEILVDLPSIQVKVNLSGCTPTIPENFCSTIPDLLLTAEEPLPNEKITFVHANIQGQYFTCEGQSCTIPLFPTHLEGTEIEFWADSTYGDTSQIFTAQVRVIDSGVSSSTTGGGWFIDIISSQWQGNQIASCAQTWQAFPPPGEPPAWLSTPEDSVLLTTDEPYAYLAGRLIAQGIVDASSCPNEGLLLNGYADSCGLNAAMPQVIAWQNSFDKRILEVAQDTRVPAVLIKNLFALESQFWPGVYREPFEYGLGQLTDNGAETILLWNPEFYNQFCPLVLDAGTCERGYIYLGDDEQAILRGALALEANADCVDCPAGIDLSQANFAIDLFAQTLLANCEQVSQIVYNATDQMPGKVSSYEDLWRFTVANYHVGAGCLSYAMYKAWSGRVDMDWANVSSFLTPACQSVIPYVEKIAIAP